MPWCPTCSPVTIPTMPLRLFMGRHIALQCIVNKRCMREGTEFIWLVAALISTVMKFSAAPVWFTYLPAKQLPASEIERCAL